MTTNTATVDNDYLKGFTLVLLSAIGYGLQPLFTHVAYSDGASPVGLLVLRFLAASSMMFIWLKLRGFEMPPLKHNLQYLLVGLGYSGAALGYYSASHSTSVSLAVILMFSFPAFVVLFSIGVLKEKATPLKLVSVALAIGGVVVAVGLDIQGDSTGVLWALFAALAYGSAILYGTHKASPLYPAQSACMVLIGCFLGALVVSSIQPTHWPQTDAGWFSVVGLALFATIFPIATFIAGAPKIGASNASTISTMEPVVAVAIALLLIGEPLNTATLIGGGMVILAVVLLSRSK